MQKVLVLKQDSNRKRIPSKGKHLQTSVHGLDRVQSYVPTTEKKLSQAVKEAEKLFTTTETNDIGFISINGSRIGYVDAGNIALNRRGNTLASVRLGLRNN